MSIGVSGSVEFSSYITGNTLREKPSIASELCRVLWPHDLALPLVGSIGSGNSYSMLSIIGCIWIEKISVPSEPRRVLAPHDMLLKFGGLISHSSERRLEMRG